MAEEQLRQHAESKLAGMRDKRQSWWQHWRELADFYLPRRYRWLVSPNQFNRGSPLNNNIKDSTGTLAARTLANGMMSGVSSPTRPWFKLKIEEFEDDLEVAAWLSICEHRMLRVFQESNFYQSVAVMWMDLSVFGTAPVIIYQDFENVIHCFNPCAGEYFFETDDKFEVRTVAREFTLTNAQIVSMFGKENVSSDVTQAMSGPEAGASSTREKLVCHVIEENKETYGVVPKAFPFREVYWEHGSDKKKILKAQGFYDWPCMTPRWSVNGNDPYASDCPGMTALGDTKQLQQETLRKAQAIDKMVNPPMIADVQLKNQPMSFLPGGVTYVAGLRTGNEGARPIYQVMPPIAEMMQDIREVQQRIKITFHNDLFTGITDLQTVRTATEIDARREEKLVLLGPVLERSIREGLGIAVDRTFGIMWRGGLLPAPPAKLRGSPTHVQVDYVNMLAIAQRGLATAGIEKTWAFAGNLAAVRPSILDNLDEDKTIEKYAAALSVDGEIMRDPKVRDEMRQAAAQKQAAVEAAQLAQAGAEGAKTLSETEVGGGANALSRILGTA